VQYLKVKKLILLLPSIGVIFAGLILIISPVMAIFAFKTLDAVTGIMAMLLFTVVGIWEMSVSRAIAGTQLGEWSGIVRTLIVSLSLRLIILFLMVDLLFMLNLVALGLEGLALSLVFINRALFMPTEEEIQSSLKRFSRVSVKTVSQCPKCSAVVETEWTLCPDCGSRLPRFCVKCNAEIKEGEQTCCNCGTVIEVPQSLLNMVETLRMTADMDGAPETRSARYARLGDGLLKVGKLDEAVDAFKKAIDSTQFTRKRTNFMVKMAVVMANKGHLDEAEKLLNEAVAIDPDDVAGAKMVMEELRKPPTDAVCPA
jgi:tetratricopeptide (TPR) repeat protein